MPDLERARTLEPLDILTQSSFVFLSQHLSIVLDSFSV